MSANNAIVFNTVEKKIITKALSTLIVLDGDSLSAEKLVNIIWIMSVLNEVEVEISEHKKPKLGKPPLFADCPRGDDCIGHIRHCDELHCPMKEIKV